MKSLILIFIIYSFSIQADDKSLPSPERVRLNSERATIDKSKADNLSQEDYQTKNLELAESEYLKASNEYGRLDTLSKNHASNRKQIIDDLEKSISERNRLERVFSRKSAFYKCVKDEIIATEAFTSDKCITLHPGKFSQDELQKIESWKSSLPLSLSELSEKQATVKAEMGFANNKIAAAKKSLGQVYLQRYRLEETEKNLKMKEFDLEVIEKNEKFVNCDENSPEISLEEKVPFEGANFQGPFYNIPRDNQDGLGTCYANTAKNLLVGASKGESVASFLDLALLYKDEKRQIAEDGLDGGFSCTVLNIVNQKGFCPQEFAPFERGEKNLYTEGLMPVMEGSVEDEAYLIKRIQDFLKADKNLKSKNSELSKRMEEKGKWMIDKIKSNPGIKLPYPVVRNQIPETWMLQADYNWNVNPKLKTTEEEFLKDYQKSYAKFLPKYTEAVIAGKKADEIFKLFELNMSDFIQKYQLQGQLGSWKKNFVEFSKEDFRDPNLKKSIIASKAFFDELVGSDKNENKGPVECEEDYGELYEFINNLKMVINILNGDKIDPSKLVNEDGKFKSSTELMQLIVAPSCLNSSQRKKLDFNLYCDKGYDYVRELKKSGQGEEEQHKSFRSRIAASLLQGYPLGNTFDRHINTIVGMRFNKQTKSCELKIRESQNGTSSWQSESDILNEIEALTEVRRN
jgi:hypothetical protein